MKKRIHIFEQWDVVERLVRSYWKATRHDHIAASKDYVTTVHGGTGFACFDFTAPHPEDKNFDGNTRLQYLDANRQWVYRPANHIEEPAPHALDRARDWVNAKLMERGIPGLWLCLPCGYRTVSESDPSAFPERHLSTVHRESTRDQIVPRIFKPTPPLPPVPLGTFYARRHKAGSEEWCVCQISHEDHGDIPWSEKILFTRATKQEAKQELIQRVTSK